jgi:hypothetical protein
MPANRAEGTTVRTQREKMGGSGLNWKHRVNNSFQDSRLQGIPIYRWTNCTSFKPCLDKVGVRNCWGVSQLDRLWLLSSTMDMYTWDRVLGDTDGAIVGRLQDLERATG